MAANGSPSLFWLNVLLVLAWIVFVDTNKTITVIWGFIGLVRQPFCQALCRRGLVHSHCRALVMTDFRWGSRGSEGGSSLTPVPQTWFAETDFLWRFCVSLRCCLFLPLFKLRNLACKSLTLENIHCVAISAFPLTFSWCKERESDTRRNFKYIFLKWLSSVKKSGRAPRAVMVCFVPVAAELGGVAACSRTCWNSPFRAQGTYLFWIASPLTWVLCLLGPRKCRHFQQPTMLMALTSRDQSEPQVTHWDTF